MDYSCHVKGSFEMSITGYYDGTVVRTDIPLKINQKVMIIPIDDTDIGTAGGILHDYANVDLIESEKTAWAEAMVKKHGK